MADFIANNLLATSHTQRGRCEGMAAVVILDRVHRRILNAEALAARARGLRHAATVVRFEGMTLPEQFRIVRCASLLVSVHGAGQQWVTFMRKGTRILSIGWKDWPPNYYKQAAKDAGVQCKDSRCMVWAAGNASIT